MQLLAEFTFSCQSGVLNRVRRRHEVEREGVRQCSSVLRGNVVYDAEETLAQA